MAVTTVAGYKARVWLGNPTTPALVGSARSWKFDIDTDLIENTQGYGGAVPAWKEFILAFFSWTGTIEGNLDTSSTVPWQGIAGNLTAPPVGAVQLLLYPDATGGGLGHYYYGSVWPKLSIEARHLSVTRFTLDFTGQGALGWV